MLVKCVVSYLGVPGRFEWVVASNFSARGTDTRENSPRRAEGHE